MGAIKVLLTTTVIATALAAMAVHVTVMTPARRLALWSEASRLLGARASPTAPVPPATSLDKPDPGPALAAVARVEVIEPDAAGQFNANADVEGHRFPVLVDTGAYMVCLTAEVAERLAYRPSPSEFRYPMSTANGRVNYARVLLPELRLGALVLRDVPAMIAPRGALFRSLLGMSFLTKLSTFRTDTGRLVLQQ